MKNLSVIGLSILALFTQACLEVTSPICNETNKADPAPFLGNYTVKESVYGPLGTIDLEKFNQDTEAQEFAKSLAERVSKNEITQEQATKEFTEKFGNELINHVVFRQTEGGSLELETNWGTRKISLCNAPASSKLGGNQTVMEILDYQPVSTEMLKNGENISSNLDGIKSLHKIQVLRLQDNEITIMNTAPDFSGLASADHGLTSMMGNDIIYNHHFSDPGKVWSTIQVGEQTEVLLKVK